MPIVSEPTIHKMNRGFRVDNSFFGSSFRLNKVQPILPLNTNSIQNLIKSTELILKK